MFFIIKEHFRKGRASKQMFSGYFCLPELLAHILHIPYEQEISEVLAENFLQFEFEGKQTVFVVDVTMLLSE